MSSVASGGGAAVRRSADRPGLTLSCFLPYRLNVVAAVASEGLARIYSERFGISIAEWRVLATLGEFRSITASEIARHAHLSKVKVSRAASALEARSLLRRRTNERDLRETFLALTVEGRTMYGHIAPLALDYAGRLAACLSSEEQALLDQLLEKLLLHAQDMPGPSASGR